MRKGISVAMIIENEGKFIENCINSIHEHLADEIIVLLDHKSNDNTRSVLEAFDKVKIYENNYKGTFNFGESRNKVLKKCNYEWTFTLDGDEVVETEQKEARQAILNMNPNQIGLAIVKQQAEDRVHAEFRQHRVFPTRKQCSYSGEVHNQFRSTNKDLFEDKVDITIKHDGFYDADKMERRIERTRAMIKVTEKKFDNDEKVTISDYYNMVKMNTVVGNLSEAVNWGEIGLEYFMAELTIKEQMNAQRFIISYMRVKMIRGEWDGIENLLLLHTKVAGETIDGCFFYYVVNLRNGNLITAFINALKYLELWEIERNMTHNMQDTIIFEPMIRERLKMLQYTIDRKVEF